MWQLIPTFPREVGTPKRFLVNTKHDFVKLINKCNGIKTLFFYLYQCDPDLNYSFSEIDKIFFDFDYDKENPQQCFDDITKLHEYCKTYKLRHMMLFSGGGYHVFVFTKHGILKNNKSALWNAHHMFCKELKLELDPAVKGDRSRLGRVPNTYNLKRRRYCIPISEDDIKKGHAFIREKAKTQQFQYHYYGTEYFDMKPYDVEREDGYDYLILDSEEKLKIDEHKILKNLPLCIAGLLQKGNIGWRQRYLIIVGLRELGYTLGETISILKAFLSEKKFNHCMIEEQNQPKTIYQRPELYFPNCKIIKNEGYCIKGCKMKNKIYL